MSRVAVAAASRIAADAGAAMARHGGNAVDAAIAASLVSMTTDPGIVALGAGSYVTISVPGGANVVIDGYVEMPGRSAPRERRGAAIRQIHIGYGGGMHTGIGHGSVATPGSIAAFGLASERFGATSWGELLQPAIGWARDGFRLGGASAEYLAISGEPIFGWHPESRSALLDRDGSARRLGDSVHCPGLEGSLRLLADDGPAAFYTGPIGRRMADDNLANGGVLGHDDLVAYEPIVREALDVDLGDWTFLTNPGPAIGGVAVGAVLALMRDVEQWDSSTVRRLAEVFDAVLSFRRHHYDHAVDREPVIARLIELVGEGDPTKLLSSPSTVHVSAVDDDGLACSITSSAGYGSGVVVPGTGIWLNNSLGEVDLLHTSLGDVEPGTRLPSNMAPSVARHRDGSVLAIGSPGASRITSAVAQVVFHHLCLGRPLTEAIEHPRLHVETLDERVVVAHEPGIDSAGLTGYERRPFDTPSMYFGGTQVAGMTHQDGLQAAADPRRVGGTAVSDPIAH